MLVESRWFVFICNNPLPPPSPPVSPRLPPPFPPPPSNTHKNKFFDNHEYSRRSLKLLLFLDSRVWRNLWNASFLSGRWQRRGINVTGSLNHWPCIFWHMSKISCIFCRIRIYGVYGQPFLQWNTTESQGLIQKFPCTICTSHSIQRKNYPLWFWQNQHALNGSFQSINTDILGLGIVISNDY